MGGAVIGLLTKAETPRDLRISLSTLNRGIDAGEVEVKREPRGQRHGICVMLGDDPPRAIETPKSELDLTKKQERVLAEQVSSATATLSGAAKQLRKGKPTDGLAVVWPVEGSGGIALRPLEKCFRLWVQQYLRWDMPRGSGNDDNRANQMNPNNDAYWQSRGYDDRPDDWEDQLEDDDGGTGGNDDNRANQLNPNNDAYRSSRG